MADHAVDPARTAVLNIDMQRCFVEGSPLAPPSGLAVLDRVNGVIDACRRLGMLVVHTRMAIRADGTNTGAAMDGLVPTFIRDLYTVGSPQWELHPGLSVDPGRRHSRQASVRRVLRHRPRPHPPATGNRHRHCHRDRHEHLL